MVEIPGSPAENQLELILCIEREIDLMPPGTARGVAQTSMREKRQAPSAVTAMASTTMTSRSSEVLK